MADRIADTRLVSAHVVWLSNHAVEPPEARRTAPVRRRWRVYVRGRLVLSVPLRAVSWSRGRG